MATIYSSNYQANYVTVPSAKAGIGEVNGRARTLVATVTFAADATSADVAKLFKIPKGARVIDYIVSCPDLGGTGVLNFGWAADAAAVEAADDDGFFASLDVSGQASLGIPVAGRPGLHKKFAAEVDAQFVLPTTSGATTKVVTAILTYVIE